MSEFYTPWQFHLLEGLTFYEKKGEWTMMVDVAYLPTPLISIDEALNFLNSLPKP